MSSTAVSDSSQKSSSQPAYHILIVDDEERAALKPLTMLLERQGYRVTAHQSPVAALATLLHEDFAVILADHYMPERRGLDFLIDTRKVRPNASRILLTGGPVTAQIVIDAINKGEIFRFINKPYLQAEMIATVRNAVQRYDLLVENARLRDKAQLLESRLSEANAELFAKAAEHERLSQELRRVRGNAPDKRG